MVNCLVLRHQELLLQQWIRSETKLISELSQVAYQIDSIVSKSDLPPMSLRGPRMAIVNMPIAFNGEK